MNIRPKNTVLFALTGVKFSLNNLRGANWRQQVFNNYRLHLLDLLTKYGLADDYGHWLNEMLSRHSNIYNLAGGEKGNWEDVAYKNALVGQYQLDYRGGIGNDGQYKRYGSVLINDLDKYDFNQTGIKTNLSTRYNIVNPPTRTSGDYSRKGYNYKVDDLYSAITDDRRLLGRKGDWDESSTEFKQWQKDLNSRGWETYLDTADNYYKLRRLNSSSVLLNGPQLGNAPQQETPELEKINGIPVGQKDDSKSDFWNKLSLGFNKIAPDLLDAIRLAGNMHNNERVYREMDKAIKPNLLQTYLTHRQVVGDEATKLAYYRRAALGETAAAQPFVADADKTIAYRNEARRNGNELRAQGDLADNTEVRRTTDESNQHQWANKERLTLKANNDTTEINKAYAAKHLLRAQKYSADWTNLDLYLLGQLAKFLLKQNKQEAIEDYIKSLQMQEDLANDQDIANAYNELEAEAKKLYPNGDVNWADPKLKDAKNKLASVRRQSMIKYYSLYAKSGTKITKKDNTDKYLYRTSRDIVEHFRRMSKMTDDSRIRTMPKPLKTSSHPRKMLLGGVAPFTIYRPLGVGGETATLVSSETGGSSKSSSKDTAAKDKLDMIKEMFKAVQNNGLPIDVNVVYRDLNNLFSRAQAFGEELSSDDIASIYLQSMLKISNLKYSLDNYNKALALATSNESLNEFAVDASGNYVVQDKEANLSLVKSLEEAREKGLNPITNLQLLNLRAYSPNLAFLKGDYMITNIINNGMGINKIGAQIKALAGNIGSTEGKLEGISQVESGKIKAGLQMLAGANETPDGHYSITNYTKDQKALILAALKYIGNMLSPSLKATLEAHGGVELNIALFLTSQLNYTNEQTITPLTGKAASSKNEKSGGGSDITPAIALSMGLGERESFVISDKTSDGLKVYAVNLPLLDSQHHAMAAATLHQVGNGDYAGQLQLNSATMGGVKISSEGINDVLISEGRIHAAELPIDMAAYQSTGIIKPNLNFLKNIEKADELVRQAGITNRDNLTPEQIKTINSIYHLNNLPIIYTMDGNGKPMLTDEYRRFALMKATAPLNAFEEDVSLANDGMIEATKDDRTRFEAMMKTVTGNAKYSLDEGISVLGMRLTGTDLYKGIIYVPMTESHISALASTGFKASPEEYNLIDALDLQALFIRSSGFKSAGSFTK